MHNPQPCITGFLLKYTFLKLNFCLKKALYITFSNGTEMNFSKPAKTLDVVGQTCPYPILETGAALRQLKVGDVLEVLLDFEMSVNSGLPNFCKKHDCEYEHKKEESNGKVYWKFYIKKSASNTLSIG